MATVYKTRLKIENAGEMMNSVVICLVYLMQKSHAIKIVPCPCNCNL